MSKRNDKSFILIVYFLLISTTILLGQKKQVKGDLIAVALEVKLLKNQLYNYSVTNSLILNPSYGHQSMNLLNHSKPLYKKWYASKKRLIQLYNIQESLNNITSSIVNINKIQDTCYCDQFSNTPPKLNFAILKIPKLVTRSININNSATGTWRNVNQFQLSLQKIIHQIDVDNKNLLLDHLKTNWEMFQITVDSINDLISYQDKLNKCRINIECIKWFSILKSSTINQCDELLIQIISHKYFRKKDLYFF